MEITKNEEKANLIFEAVKTSFDQAMEKISAGEYETVSGALLNYYGIESKSAPISTMILGFCAGLEYGEAVNAVIRELTEAAEE